MVRTSNPGYLRDIRRIIVYNIYIYRLHFQEQNLVYIYLEICRFSIEFQNYKIHLNSLYQNHFIYYQMKLINQIENIMIIN